MCILFKIKIVYIVKKTKQTVVKIKKILSVLNSIFVKIIVSIFIIVF
jgi:hypothetical protein